MSSPDVRQKVFRVPSSVVLSVGLSWDYIGASPVDLDLSAVCFTKEGQVCDVVFFNHLFPEGTDEESLRAQYLVNPEQLPYMFLSGDSMVGGEEENQLSGLALASRRRKHMVMGHHRSGKRRATAAAESLFNRLYEEEDLAGVQEAVDDYYANGGEIFDENGTLVRRRPQREMCDEVLTLVGAKIPAQAEVIFICVSSYTGQDFSVLTKAKLVIHNETMDERVGTMDIKSTTGSGTANLAAMFVRVPPEGGSGGGAGDGAAYWDLRELNVRTFGYTFVDVLPLMLDVLGVPANSRMDALAYLIDYPLVKDRVRLADQPLSDLRFGLGWDGEHDLDAFLVMLDEQNNYVDHVYPKQGKLRSTVVPDMARHSGDALTGMNTAGDEEFVDLLTYRVPSNVRTILLGCTYMESFGAGKDCTSSIYDVPKLYMRLQNRTLDNPFSFEVDRWDVRKDFKRAQRADVSEGRKRGGKKDDTKEKTSSAKVKTTYRAADRTTQPVRALLMGILMKKGTVPFETLFPDGRRIDQHFRRPDRDESVSRETVMEAGLDEEVPLFELVPVHQYVPVDPRGGFSGVIPLLQCVTAFLCGTGASYAPGARGENSGNATGGGTMNGTSMIPTHNATALSSGGAGYVLDRENHIVGWDHSTIKAVGGQGAMGSAHRSIWEQMRGHEKLTERFALEVRFLEVLALEPQLPDRFKCHGEAWVCGQSDSITGQDLNRPFKTPFLVNRDRMVWDRNSGAAATTFLVHRYDRIRVLLYEFAAFGYADIDLMQMGELWEGDGRPVECTVALLGGGHLSKGEVRVRLTRTAYKHTHLALQKERDRIESRQQAKARADKECAEASQNQSYSPCAVM